MRIKSVFALALVLSLLATGCKKGEEADEHPAPSPSPAPAPDGGGKGDKDGKETKKNFANSGLSALFSKDSAPTYAWDGQSSSVTLDLNPNETYRRSVAGLRAMGFVIKDEVSKKESGKSHIQGAKTDQTQVSVWIEEAADKSGKTLVHVKVGGLGDRTGSERVLDEIQKVRTRPAAAKPAPKATTAPAPSAPAATPPANSQQP